MIAHRLALLGAIIATGLIPSPAGAQTDRFWQGPGAGAWDVSANWTLGAPGFPNAPGDGALNIQTTTTSTSQATVGGVTVGKIGHDAVNVNTSWTITATTAITLNNLGLGSIIRNTDTSTGASNQLIILGIGGLTLADNLNVINTGGSTANNGSINLNTVISGTGNITISNVSNSFVNDNGAVFLQGTNTFVGNTTIAKGLTKFNNAKAFSTGQINLGQTGQGDASLLSTTAINAANNIVVAAGTGGTSLLGSSTSGTATYSGLITLNGDVTFTNLDAGGTGITRYTNTISGNGGVRVIGPGTSVLTHANTYSGGTTVSSGTLLVNNTSGSGTGSGAVVVNSGGTLGGTGTIIGPSITGTTAVTVSGGTISAGTVGTVGALAIRNGAFGALTLTSNATFVADIAGTGTANYDQINVIGTVTLGGTLQVNELSGFKCKAGDSFILINNDLSDAITGTFSNAPTNGSIVTVGADSYYVNYNGGDGNDLLLTCVPEPSTWVAGILAVGAVGLTQRRRFVRFVRCAA